MINMLSYKYDESVAKLIDRQAHSYPERVFLIEPETGLEISFLQLQKLVQGVAQHIASKGVPPGSSVAYAMSNGACCAITLLGIMYGGYRAVAVNLVAGRDVIAYVLAHSQTAMVLTQSDHAQLINEALHCDEFTESSHSGSSNFESSQCESSQCESSQCDPFIDGANLSDEVHAAAANSIIKPSVLSVTFAQIQSYCGDLQATEQRKIHASRDALLMYTSGTTGRPKGVTLSQSNVIAGGLNVAVGHELSADDRALCVLPLYHINGLCVTLFGPLFVAGSLVLPTRFSTSAFWGYVDAYLCTWFSVVPTQIAYLLRDADTTELAVTKRSHLRFGRSASAPLSPDVHDTFERRFGVPLIETMGLTETAAQILSNPMPPLQRKLGSPGVPVGDEVIVADKALNEVAADVEGELLVRGANVMQRYFRNESATRDALTSEGWLRTGDLGRKDADGYIFVTGRLKELIIKGGENIAPREIDDALYQQSDVVEAAAFARPCGDFGQRVEAAVVIKTGSSLDEAALLELCTERLGKFRCPDKIHFLAELPKGPSGKIQRAKIGDVIYG